VSRCPAGAPSGFASLVLVSALGLGAARAAEELPLPGPSVEGPVYKAGDPAAPAGATEKPLWELGLGVAGVRFPDYRGSDQSNFYLLPLPYIAYRGKLLRADSDGARAILFSGKRSRSTSASRPRCRRAASTTTRARACPISPAPSRSAQPQCRALAVRRQAVKFEFRMPLRQAITLESHPHSAGLTLSPNVNVDVRDFIGGWKLGALIGPHFGNQRQHQYFYGVAPEFATPERPAYDAPGGYSGWRAIAALSRRYGNLYAGGFVRYDGLRGAAYAPSPLVRSDHAVHRRLRPLMDLRGIGPARRGGRLTPADRLPRRGLFPRLPVRARHRPARAGVARLEPGRAAAVAAAAAAPARADRPAPRSRGSTAPAGSPPSGSA
jgi:outer membrane scaffolding protein for murein synthesis (MipA/OmpV family)